MSNVLIIIITIIYYPLKPKAISRKNLIFIFLVLFRKSQNKEVCGWLDQTKIVTLVLFIRKMIKIFILTSWPCRTTIKLIITEIVP